MFAFYTEAMAAEGREVALFDPAVGSWNEQMTSEEFAVHGTDGAANCRVFSSLEQAESFARQQVALRPDLRARIYGHEGFIGAPVGQLTGASFKGERDLSPRVRRWLGIGFLAVGSGLVVWDWSTGFRMTWPGVLGSRLLIPGAILVATEFLIWLTARQRARRETTS